MTTTRVGFIGLGNMGSPLATNIATAGFETAVYDLRPEATNDARSAGAHPTNSVADVVHSADVVSSCVFYESQLRDLYLADDGILAHATPGLITMIHSTVAPSALRDLATAAAEQDVIVLDAPVSGGSEIAAKGELTSIVSGKPGAFDTVRPILNSFSAHCFYVSGQPGDAQIVKLSNNIMTSINQIGIMEALRFAAAQGIPNDVVLKVAAVSSGASWAIDTHTFFDELRLHHTLAGTDELPHALAKDLHIATEEAHKWHTSLPVVALAAQLSPAMWAERWGRLSDDEHS